MFRGNPASEKPYTVPATASDAKIIADGMYAVAEALHAIAKAMTTGPEESPDEAPTQYLDGTPAYSVNGQPGPAAPSHPRNVPPPAPPRPPRDI